MMRSSPASSWPRRSSSSTLKPRSPRQLLTTAVHVTASGSSFLACISCNKQSANSQRLPQALIAALYVTTLPLRSLSCMRRKKPKASCQSPLLIAEA